MLTTEESKQYGELREKYMDSVIDDVDENAHCEGCGMKLSDGCGYTNYKFKSVVDGKDTETPDVLSDDGVWLCTHDTRTRIDNLDFCSVGCIVDFILSSY